MNRNEDKTFQISWNSGVGPTKLRGKHVVRLIHYNLMRVPCFESKFLDASQDTLEEQGAVGHWNSEQIDAQGARRITKDFENFGRRRNAFRSTKGHQGFEFVVVAFRIK
jgi:hypothetical protein